MLASLGTWRRPKRKIGTRGPVWVKYPSVGKSKGQTSFCCEILGKGRVRPWTCKGKEDHFSLLHFPLCISPMQTAYGDGKGKFIFTANNTLLTYSILKFWTLGRETVLPGRLILPNPHNKGSDIMPCVMAWHCKAKPQRREEAAREVLAGHRPFCPAHLPQGIHVNIHPMLTFAMHSITTALWLAWHRL